NCDYRKLADEMAVARAHLATSKAIREKLSSATPATQAGHGSAREALNRWAPEGIKEILHKQRNARIPQPGRSDSIPVAEFKEHMKRAKEEWAFAESENQKDHEKFVLLVDDLFNSYVPETAFEEAALIALARLLWKKRTLDGHPQREAGLDE